MSSIEWRLENVVEQHLASLRDLHRSQAKNHNPFLESISPTVAVASKLTRSLTSRLGTALAGIARDCAIERYGEGKVPRVAYRTDVKWVLDDPGQHGDTTIVTNLNEAETKQAATRLLREGRASGNRLGTPAFRDAFLRELDRLEGLPRSSEPWTVRVDLLVEAPEVGVCELESGGELDSSNVKGQPEKLVLAGLALGRRELPLHFCLAYANQGEGKPVRGGLPGYLAYAREYGYVGGLLVGQEWWERVLPSGLSMGDLLRATSSVAAQLDIVPKDLR